MRTHFFNFFNFFFFFFIALFLVLLVQSSGFPLNFSPDAGNFEDPWQHFMNFSGCHAGDHAPGLSKLKQYFQLFGYIPEPSSLTNFTDDFDEAFETAIKTYQLNFNLPATGTLDDSTLKRIVQPRCGVADIINGSTTMNSGGQHKPMHSPAIHSVGHYSFFPGQPRWPPFKRDLTYSFSPRNQLTDSVKSVFKRAFDRWAAVTPLTFTETPVFSMADMRIGFFSGDHGDGEPFDGVLGTLAHAFSPPDGRFHLDAAENWVVDASLATASTTAVDLESVAVHEIGHLLGLGHSSVEEAIMFPTISSRAKKVELARDDIEGIQVLYGGNPSYQSSDRSSPPASQERERSDSGGGRLLVGVGWWTTLVLTPLVMLIVHFL